MGVERNIPPGLYVEWCGDVLAVTHLFRGHDDCDEVANATSFVAGPLADGSWLASSVEDFDFRRLL